MKNKKNVSVRMAEEGIKTILHRGFTESIKKRHTEGSKAHRKPRHSEGDGYSLKIGKWRAGTPVNALKVAKIKSSCTQANMLAVFLLTTARDGRWWTHCWSLGFAWNVNEFLCKTVCRALACEFYWTLSAENQALIH